MRGRDGKTEKRHTIGGALRIRTWLKLLTDTGKLRRRRDTRSDVDTPIRI